jgi:hypothetical protein
MIHFNTRDVLGVDISQIVRSLLREQGGKGRYFTRAFVLSREISKIRQVGDRELSSFDFKSYLVTWTSGDTYNHNQLSIHRRNVSLYPQQRYPAKWKNRRYGKVTNSPKTSDMHASRESRPQLREMS